MSYQIFLVISVQISILSSAPMLMMPIPWMAQSTQQVMLQKQLMELQAMQQLSVQPPVLMNNQPQPMLIILPGQEAISGNNANELKLHKENHKPTHTNIENEDDLNSVIIDAASEAVEEQNQVAQPQRAILLVPNARLSIGGIISAIPWLPIEINVPDTISWVYNGIASGIGSIISIIGRPFQGTQAQLQEEGMKSVWKQIQTKQNNMFRPIVMMPIDGPVLPIQV